MFNAGLHQQAIDHDFNGVVLSLIEIDFIFKIDQFAIDTSPGEAVLDQLLHLFFELALAATHNRSHDHDAILRGQGHHPLDDLLGGLARDRPPAFRAMRNPYRGVKKAKVVIDLSNGTDGGSWAAAGGPLLDRNGWAEPVNRVHVGTLHLIKELPGIGRERLHVPALALRINRVKGERRLARTAQPCDDRQGVPGDFYIDILEVMLACPTY